MSNTRIQQGELAYWLAVVDGSNTSAQADEMPPYIADALQLLRCIEPDGDGFRLTDKGRLSLRMADPAAIHKQ